MSEGGGKGVSPDGVDADTFLRKNAKPPRAVVLRGMVSRGESGVPTLPTRLTFGSSEGVVGENLGLLREKDVGLRVAQYVLVQGSPGVGIGGLDGPEPFRNPPPARAFELTRLRNAILERRKDGKGGGKPRRSQTSRARLPSTPNVLAIGIALMSRPLPRRRRRGGEKVGTAPIQGGPSGGGGRDTISPATRNTLSGTNVVRNILVISYPTGSKFEHVTRGAAAELLVGHKGGRRHQVDKRRRGRRYDRRGGRTRREGGRVGEVEVTLGRRPEASIGALET